MITMDDKYRFEDFGLIPGPGHEHPATPYFRRKTMHIPGRPGLLDFGTEIEEKPLNFPLSTKNIDSNEMQGRLNDFLAFLFDEYGQPREIKVVYDYEPDKFYMAKVSSSFNPRRVRPFSSFVLPMVADEGYKFSNVFADEVTWGSEMITFEADYLLGHTNDFAGDSTKITGPQTLNISVSGLVVQPNIIIEGTANNLTLSANGHSFSLPNFSNATWKIDFEKYLVYRNGQETMIEIRDFILKQGNNEIKVTGSNINIDLQVKFHDKYN